MDRILMLVEHIRNRRLVAASLAPYYDVCFPEREPALDVPCDLVMVDTLALDLRWHDLQVRKADARPAFLPCLMLASHQQQDMVTRHLGKTVDAVFWLPVDNAVFHTQVDHLLHVRQQSLTLHELDHALEMVPEGFSPVSVRNDGPLALASAW